MTEVSLFKRDDTCDVWIFTRIIFHNGGGFITNLIKNKKADGKIHQPFYLHKLIAYSKAFNLASKVAFGTAPTCLSTTSPFLMNKIVGMFLIPNSAAISPS